MPGKISDETRQLIEKLYAQDFPYREISRRAKVSYTTVFGCTKFKERGHTSYTEYQEYLAKQRGYASRSEYRKHLAEQKRKLIRKKLSDLITHRLNDLQKDQRWLAEQLGITEEAVSEYISRETTPRRSLQKRLFEALKLSYQTLDDLLE